MGELVDLERSGLWDVEVLLVRWDAMTCLFKNEQDYYFFSYCVCEEGSHEPNLWRIEVPRTHWEILRILEHCETMGIKTMAMWGLYAEMMPFFSVNGDYINHEAQGRHPLFGGKEARRHYDAHSDPPTSDEGKPDEFTAEDAKAFKRYLDPEYTKKRKRDPDDEYEYRVAKKFMMEWDRSEDDYSTEVSTASVEDVVDGDSDLCEEVTNPSTTASQAKSMKMSLIGRPDVGREIWVWKWLGRLYEEAPDPVENAEIEDEGGRLKSVKLGESFNPKAEYQTGNSESPECDADNEMEAMFEEWFNAAEVDGAESVDDNGRLGSEDGCGCEDNQQSRGTGSPG